MDTGYLLLVALLMLPFFNWPVAIILIRLSRMSPSIKALSERAWLAALIALVTTVYVVVTWNTQFGYNWFTFDTGRTIVRLSILGIGLYPLWWLWAYYTGRFKDE